MVKVFGNLFNNKQATGNQPIARGTVNITQEFIDWLNTAPKNQHGSVEVDIAAWNKTGPKAGKYMSLNLSPPQGSTQIQPKRKADPEPEDYSDDEIPF